ncbi:PREDICTED: rho GTPase-activating protein 20-like [Miniopterus natalensis]|uniref:rho GTPase-activating protein 20-like n=1 Tax=Miniopterus natalensis TaxID=291302 RepID=UPI0007A6DBE3|nr:PREDICTED: rho GTPase-activating protein 20-like [Miniopterus natalensis]
MSPGAQQPRMKKMKAPAERRWRAPSLTLGKALGKGPSTKEGPSAGVDTCAFLSSFVCSNRTLLLEGPVELKRGRQRWERHLFLFNDMCVVAKVKYNNNFKMKNKIKLSDMWAAGCVDEAGDGNADAMRSFILGWPTVNFVATFSSPEQKDKWLSLLQRYISLEKEKDYPKSIPLKIFTKDMGNCAYSKIIIIKNSDTAKEVINMLLPMLRISGSERDYQLWVSSGKEAAPYPLTGHEYPYGIKMSHLRDTALLTQGSEDSTSPSKLRELFLMEQLPREMQCQFTLQPSLLAAAQQLSDSGPKTSKRRRSRIKWAFWQGASARLDNSPTSPTSPMPGQLFGASLPSICENDNLPKPVSDMLFFLNQEGPLTEGIFRLSASVKSCRELKEKLNSGAEVRLDCESIFMIASVLKDFLRNIPGSILSSDLCHHWVSVMDQGNDEEKINTIQRLLDQLPRANVVLLRYLFGVLHNIEQHSSSNKMTAFNLAVCIAPSILWPPNSSSPELENEFIKKVTPLIQFLIENCCRIFGEEITSLFGKASAKCDTEEKASSISCLQVTDSSCDSLKKKLIADADAPCSDVLKDLGQASRSMASVLTLSDDDLNQPEVEGLLILRDFDLDSSKHEDIEMEPSPEYKPLTVAVLDTEPTLQEHAGDPSGMTEPSYLSTAAADAPKSLRQHQYPLESSTSYLDSKLSSLKQFYQKKLRKSRHGAVPSQKDEDHLKQKQPLQEEGTACFKESLVTGTDIKNNDIKKSAKKKSLFGNKGNHGKLLPRSKAGAISVASCSHMSPQDHPRSQPFGLDTSGTALPHTTGALKNSERQQLCSEPNIDVQPCKRSYLRRIFSKKQNKTDYASGHLHREEDHLKPQIEGQNLVNQSLVMGIEVDKSSATKQNTRCLPWRLNICLSCISTSPCDSSGSSQDSAFSQISEHSVCTPTETSSPIDCNFQAQSKPGELSSDFCSPSLISGVPGTSSGQTGSCLAYTNNDSVECHSQMHSVTLHPSMWLRNGLASLKTWSFKKKARAPRSEEKKLASQKESMEPPPCASGVLEANSLQENPKDMPLTATERVGAVLTGHQHSSCPNRDSEKHSRSPFSLVEDSLKLRMSHEEGKNSGQCSPGTPPCERSSPSSLIVDEVSSPDSGSAAVKDVGNKHSTKDI